MCWCFRGKVGRIVKIESAERTVVTIAVQRPFKNENGEHETDFLPIVLWGAVSETTLEYCKQGDIIGIRERVQSEDGKVVIIADKVTFLSSKKEDKDE